MKVVEGHQNIMITVCELFWLQTRIMSNLVSIQGCSVYSGTSQDTLNKGHLSNENTVCSPNNIELCTNLSLN